VFYWSRIAYRTRRATSSVLAASAGKTGGGHLGIRGPRVLVDSDVKPLMTEPTDRVVDLFSPAGRDVAVALLLAPDEYLGTMEIARRTGRSAGPASGTPCLNAQRRVVESTGLLRYPSCRSLSRLTTTDSDNGLWVRNHILATGTDYAAPLDIMHVDESGVCNAHF
jgi:hypothetical protein